MKILLAFLIAPLAPIAIIGPVLVLQHGELGAAGPIVFLCVVYGYPAELILGTPVYLLARRKGWLCWWQAGAAGAVVGAFLPLVILTSMELGLDRPLDLKTAVAVLGLATFSATVGAVSGLAFWFVGLRSSNNAFKRKVPLRGPAA